MSDAEPLPPSARPAITADLMETTGLDDDVLRRLVRHFYEQVRTDGLLGPIFEDRIDDWPAHLDRMAEFWSSVALMTGRYHGAPMPAHARLPVVWAHFDRWLDLFRAAADETCPPEGAAHVVDRAERIARSLHQAVENAARLAPGSGKESAMTETAAEPPPVGDAAALTRHIETRFHARHRDQLPVLAALAEKVETVHFGDDSVPEGLSGVLRRMIGELEVHMKKEELLVFPAIRRGGRPGLAETIAKMRADHDDHGEDIDRIRGLTADLTLPPGACRSWAELYAGLGTFVEDLAEHVRLENEVLFPPFEQEGEHHV